MVIILAFHVIPWSERSYHLKALLFSMWVLYSRGIISYDFIFPRVQTIIAFSHPFLFFFSAILVVTRLAFKFTTDNLLSHAYFVFCISFSNLGFIVVIIITISTISFCIDNY